MRTARFRLSSPSRAYRPDPRRTPGLLQAAGASPRLGQHRAPAIPTTSQSTPDPATSWCSTRAGLSQPACTAADRTPGALRTPRRRRAVATTLLRARRLPGRWNYCSCGGKVPASGKLWRGPAAGSSLVQKSSLPQGEQAHQLPLEVEILASFADGVKTVRLSSEEGIDALGRMPLPPYIHQRLENPDGTRRYTHGSRGSVAAPTAGLHFTPGLMAALQELGVKLAFVTLHVGLDTFRPVKGDDPAAHQIHTEYFELGPKPPTN